MAIGKCGLYSPFLLYFCFCVMNKTKGTLKRRVKKKTISFSPNSWLCAVVAVASSFYFHRSLLTIAAVAVVLLAFFLKIWKWPWKRVWNNRTVPQQLVCLRVRIERGDVYESVCECVLAWMRLYDSRVRSTHRQNPGILTPSMLVDVARRWCEDRQHHPAPAKATVDGTRSTAPESRKSAFFFIFLNDDTTEEATTTTRNWKTKSPMAIYKFYLFPGGGGGRIYMFALVGRSFDVILMVGDWWWWWQRRLCREWPIAFSLFYFLLLLFWFNSLAWCGRRRQLKTQQNEPLWFLAHTSTRSQYGNGWFIFHLFFRPLSIQLMM